MSKKSSDQKVQVVEYSMAMHMGICHGPIGAIKRILIGEKVAWSGDQEETADLSINRPDLFGGEQKEGGVVGTVRALFGEADQTLPEGLAARLGLTTATCPGFRGLLTLFFTNGDAGFIWGHNTPYLKTVWVELERLPGIDGMDWYPETAPILREEGRDFTGGRGS